MTRSSLPSRRPTSFMTSLATACLVALAGAAWAAPPSNAAPAACDRDVWLVGTRRLPAVCGLPAAADLDVERHVEDAGCGRWQQAGLEDLLGDDARPLVIFIHGNRYDAASARAQGIRLADHMAARCPTAGPVRTVVFSWPSEKQGLLLKDGRAKYQRAHADAHYLAWLLGRVDPGRPVAIVAYSFGAIIALEAIEDLVAAERSGRADVTPWVARPGRTHLVFVAAAVRCDALAPRGPYAEAFACVDRVSLVLNSRDDALHFFPCLDRSLRAEALGYVGMPRAWVPGDVEFTSADGAAIVGRNHGLGHYLASPTLSQRIATGALDGLGD